MFLIPVSYSYTTVPHTLQENRVPESGIRGDGVAGDFVDRGAWGLETLLLLAAWKLALPDRVLLLRGNHETATCSKLYGFYAELGAKLGVRVRPSALAPLALAVEIRLLCFGYLFIKLLLLLRYLWLCFRRIDHRLFDHGLGWSCGTRCWGRNRLDCKRKEMCPTVE